MKRQLGLLAVAVSLLWTVAALSALAQASRKPPAAPPAGSIEWNGRHYMPAQYRRIAKDRSRSVMLSAPERARSTPVTFVAAVAEEQKLGLNDLILQRIEPAQTTPDTIVLTVEMLEGNGLAPGGRAILVGDPEILGFVSPDRIRVTGVFLNNYRTPGQESVPVVEAQLTELLTPPAVRLAWEARPDIRGVVILGQVTNAGSRDFSSVRIAAESATLASYYSADSVGNLKPGETKSFRISLIGSGLPRTTDVNRYFRVYVEDYRLQRPRTTKSKSTSKPTAARP